MKNSYSEFFIGVYVFFAYLSVFFVYLISGIELFYQGNLTLTAFTSMLIKFQTLISFDYDAEQVWVLDSVPGEVNPEEGDGEVEKVLQTLQNLPPHFTSRRSLLQTCGQKFINMCRVLWVETFGKVYS